MRKCLVFNYSEIGLKKGNRKYFEEKLYEHLRIVAKRWNLGKFKNYRGRYMLFLDDIDNIQPVIDDFQKIFGLTSVFTGYFTERSFETALVASQDLLKHAATFKVAAKRIDKSFTPGSMDINANFGGEILEAMPHLKVDVRKPDVMLHFEVFHDGFLIFRHAVSACGGLPYGTSGKVVSMLSGGIDSPVATWMMMKRGCDIIPVHFHTPPYTGDGSLDKVIELAKILAKYTRKGLKLHVVNMTQLQIAIKKHGKQKNITLLSRRVMARISMEIALKEKALGIVTGEALSQVASQTIHNLNCVNDIYTLPAFRPLIGFDKVEIIERAQKIGTFDTSIRPEVDCCQLFSPSHPETKGKPQIILADETHVLKTFDGEFPYEVDIIEIEC